MGRACVERLGEPWSGENIVGFGEGTGIQVDGSIVVEVNCHLGELVLLAGRTNNIGINQSLELLRSKSGGELERSTQERLRDGEGSERWVSVSHCDDIRLQGLSIVGVSGAREWVSAD